MRRSARGATLAELMVVIVILGVMAAVTGVAFLRKTPVPAADARLAAVAAARSTAIASGHDSTFRVSGDSGTWLVTVHADGRIVTDAALGLDQLSGRPAHAAR